MTERIISFSVYHRDGMVEDPWVRTANSTCGKNLEDFGIQDVSLTHALRPPLVEGWVAAAFSMFQA